MFVIVTYRLGVRTGVSQEFDTYQDANRTMRDWTSWDAETVHNVERFRPDHDAFLREQVAEHEAQELGFQARDPHAYTLTDWMTDRPA